MIDAVGGLAASVIGYFSLKHNKDWLVPKLLDPKPKKERKTFKISKKLWRRNVAASADTVSVSAQKSEATETPSEAETSSGHVPAQALQGADAALLSETESDLQSGE